MALRFKLDTLRIGIDGFKGQSEDLGNLFIGLAVRHKLDDIQLAAGQRSHRVPLRVLARGFQCICGEHRFFSLSSAWKCRPWRSSKFARPAETFFFRSARWKKCATSDAPRFRERPAFIPGQLQCFLSSRIEVAMPMPNMMESRDGLFHWR